jgi:putative RNA 2'-phosphotransferase
LSSTIVDAVQVGKRKDNIPAILEINACLAFNSGINFYLADNNIWLSKFIPAEFIHINNGRT